MMQSVEKINELKAQCFGGTDTYYRYPGLTAITSGLQDFCEAAECFWLLDLIASYQRRIAKRYPQAMQIWKLSVTGHTGYLKCRCEDGVPPVVHQAIEFTDFPLPEQVVYVGSDGVACLPEEY